MNPVEVELFARNSWIDNYVFRLCTKALIEPWYRDRVWFSCKSELNNKVTVEFLGPTDTQHSELQSMWEYDHL